MNPKSLLDFLLVFHGTRVSLRQKALRPGFLTEKQDFPTANSPLTFLSKKYFSPKFKIEKGTTLRSQGIEENAKLSDSFFSVSPRHSFLCFDKL